MPSRSIAHGLFLVLVPVLAGLVGCTSLAYDRIALGAAPREYDRSLPEANTRRSEIGLTHWNGQSESIVILLAQDRRVAGKLHAAVADASDRRFTPRRPRYMLRAEIDRSLYDVGETSPIDVIRIVMAELRDIDDDPRLRSAHDRLLAGLSQSLNRWPGLDEAPNPAAARREYEELAPAGGELALRLIGNVLELTYRVD